MFLVHTFITCKLLLTTGYHDGVYITLIWLHDVLHRNGLVFKAFKLFCI